MSRGAPRSFQSGNSSSEKITPTPMDQMEEKLESEMATVLIHGFIRCAAACLILVGGGKSKDRPLFWLSHKLRVQPGASAY